jgi:hypothetical protein
MVDATFTAGYAEAPTHGHRDDSEPPVSPPRCVRLPPLIVAAVAWLTLAYPPAVTATVVLPAAFTQMVSESQVIVHGRVADVRSVATAGRRTIESIVTVEVVDGVKGVAGRTVSFRVPNGQVGRYRRIMVGAPEFTAGDEVVLFLKGRAPGMPVPYGLNQGVYRVSRRDGRATVAPLVADGAGRVVRGDPARRPLGIDAFVRQVRVVIEGGR